MNKIQTNNIYYNRLKIILLLIVVIIACFFRLWKLHSIPPGLYPDEAINGNDALISLRFHNFNVFYPENNGREGLFINLISLSFKIFGVSPWSIRVVSATIGILTILGIYLLTKEIFLFSGLEQRKSDAIALLSSFFLATSFWHINFSRIGFRGILVPFITTFSFYFLIRGFRKQKKASIIIGSVFFGLGFYTYTVFRLSILLLLLILIFFYFTYKKNQLKKTFFILATYLFLFIFITALPISIYFLENPKYFLERTVKVSIFSQNSNTPFSQIKSFNSSLVKHLEMFNFIGDHNWRHNISDDPELLRPIGILFIIGFLIEIKEIFRKLNYKNKQSLFAPYFLISAFFIMLTPSIITFEGIPHALRSIGVVPIVYVFAGLGLWEIYQWFDKNTKNKKLLIITTIIFLLSIIILQYNKYFIQWAKNPAVKEAFSEDYVKIGNYLNLLSQKTKKYVIVNQPGVPVQRLNGIPMPAQTVMFIENTKPNTKRSIYLLPEDTKQIKIGENTTVVLMKYDQGLVNRLRQKFPEGKIEQKNHFWIYKIKNNFRHK